MKKTARVLVIAVAAAVCLGLFANAATAGWYKWRPVPVVVVPPCPVVKYCAPAPCPAPVVRYCAPPPCSVPVVKYCGPVFCPPPLFLKMKLKKWLRGCGW